MGKVVRPSNSVLAGASGTIAQPARNVKHQDNAQPTPFAMFALVNRVIASTDTARLFSILRGPDSPNLPICRAKGLFESSRDSNLLAGTSVTDASLDHLVSLPNLTFLNIERTQITLAEIKRFQAKNPLCELKK